MDGSDDEQYDWSVAWGWPRNRVSSINGYMLGYRASSRDRSVFIKCANLSVLPRSDASYFIGYEEEAFRAAGQHPHLVRLLDAQGEGADRTLMFEWIEGRTIASLPRLSLEAATKLFREIASAVCAIHKGGFLHSDLHPGNVMLRNGHAIVLDLDLAYPLHKSSYFTTYGGMERYCAPERYNSERADTYSDVYSLGVLFYYLLRRQHAFYEDDWVRVCDKLMPPHIPSVPQWVNQVIRKATRHQPSERFQTVEDMLAALPAE